MEYINLGKIHFTITDFSFSTKQKNEVKFVVFMLALHRKIRICWLPQNYSKPKCLDYDSFAAGPNTYMHKKNLM